MKCELLCVKAALSARSQLRFPQPMWSIEGDRQANIIWTRPSKHMQHQPQTLWEEIWHTAQWIEKHTVLPLCPGMTRLNLLLSEIQKPVCAALLLSCYFVVYTQSQMVFFLCWRKWGSALSLIGGHGASESYKSWEFYKSESPSCCSLISQL